MSDTVHHPQKLNSFTSDISRIFTGAPTDRSIWMMVGGV
ncbi:DUF3185 family protein [Undibacterium arcticum]|uniref:DUF3185 family protein n=1 Tax=Undibacterium arcticum TaxID=1762892 RepID=A0ABV7F9E5_9BURK